MGEATYSAPSANITHRVLLRADNIDRPIEIRLLPLTS